VFKTYELEGTHHKWPNPQFILNLSHLKDIKAEILAAKLSLR
jgi:hypothetical protein